MARKYLKDNKYSPLLTSKICPVICSWTYAVPRSSDNVCGQISENISLQMEATVSITSRLSSPLLAHKMSALTHLTVRLNCDWAPQLHPGPACFVILWSLSFSRLPFLSFPLSSFSFLPPFLLNSQHQPGCRQQWPRIR